jgi:hypothetical protein
MPEIVFGGKLRAARLQQLPHPLFEFDCVVAFPDNVVLMEDVAEKMPIVKAMKDRARYFIRKNFEPIAVIASECYVERDYVFDLAVVEGPVTDRSASRNKAVTKSPLALVSRAFNKITMERRKN